MLRHRTKLELISKLNDLVDILLVFTWNRLTWVESPRKPNIFRTITTQIQQNLQSMDRNSGERNGTVSLVQICHRGGHPVLRYRRETSSPLLPPPSQSRTASRKPDWEGECRLEGRSTLSSHCEEQPWCWCWFRVLGPTSVVHYLLPLIPSQLILHAWRVTVPKTEDSFSNTR